MNKAVCGIGFVIFTMGFILYLVAIPGNSDAESEYIEAQKDYYMEINSDDPDRIEARESTLEMHEAAVEMQEWKNIVSWTTAIIYLGIAIVFLSLIYPDNSKDLFETSEPSRPSPQARPIQPKRPPSRSYRYS